MSLLDDLKNPPKRVRSFPEWFNAQSPELQAGLEAAANDTDWSDSGLEKLIRKYKGHASKDSINAWRADVAAR